jgi:PhzF family phenazine biosynthesis protein
MSKTLPIFQVDAFSSKTFSGNPAAVCPLETWLSDDLLQKIAEENNLAETAYFIQSGDSYEIRWFTPTVEVDLCGHATLASAFVIFNFLEPKLSEIKFQTRQAGPLRVTRRGLLIELDFPEKELKRIEAISALSQELGFTPEETFLMGDDTYVVIGKSEEQIRLAKPDIENILKLGKCVSISAPGDQSDFVSRYFAPTHGIAEDAVTGSSFCYLTPYWSKKLGKTDLHAFQISTRGGEILTRLEKDRVKIAGEASLYLRGSIFV